MAVRIILALLVGLAVLSAGTDYEDLDSSYSIKTIRVNFQDCPDGQQTCKVRYESTNNLTVKFQFIDQHYGRNTIDEVYTEIHLSDGYKYRKYYDKYDYHYNPEADTEPVKILKGAKPCREGIFECPLKADGTIYTFDGTIKLGDYQFSNYQFIFNLNDPSNEYLNPILSLRFNVTF